MTGLETIYWTLANPSISMKSLQDSKPIGWAFFVILLSTISNNVSGILIGAVNLNTAKVMLSFGLLVGVIMVIGMWIVATALIHLFAEWLDGQGKVSTLFTALGFSFVPSILMTPFALLLQTTSAPIKSGLFLIFYLIVLIWIVKLQIIAIKEVYQVSSFRAGVILSTPTILCLLSIISLVIIGLLMSFSLALSSFPSPIFR